MSYNKDDFPKNYWATAAKILWGLVGFFALLGGCSAKDLVDEPVNGGGSSFPLSEVGALISMAGLGALVPIALIVTVVAVVIHLFYRYADHLGNK